MNKNYIAQLDKAIQQNLTDMAALECQGQSPQEQEGGINSQGLTVIVGVTGKRHGRIILDTKLETARKLSELINEEKDIEHQLMLDTISEFTNIVSGHTITLVNNLEKDLGLMLTPPSVFYGNGFKITSPKISAQTVNYRTPLGDITISIGFEGGR